MDTTRSFTNNLINLDIIFTVMLWISLLLLSVIALVGYIAPIVLYIFMITIGVIAIVLFSNKDEIYFKIKLFIFFFSLYLTYVLMNHYILLTLFPNTLPFNYIDENTFYFFSNLGLPYVSGEKNFFDMFDMYKVFQIHELPLHVVFSSIITYFSILIDGINTIIVQKLLSPFFGGLFSVVLYSTVKYQFKDRIFTLNATIVYGLFSAVFMYSTPLLRDIDVALAYMIFIYLFMQKNSFINFLLLSLVAFSTFYLRPESGMVLFGLTLLFAYFYVKELQFKSLKLIFYILLMVLFSFVVVLVYNKIIGKVASLDEGNVARSIARASEGSIGVLLNRLPFGVSHTAKVLFGQLQPFPFFSSIDKPLAAVSGVFWPFIFIIMIFTIKNRDIRDKIDIKIKYLLVAAITVLFLMSSEPMARRMMSVYPIMYITALHTFYFVKKNNIQRMFYYYLFAIITLNTIYYLIKI